MKKKIFILFCFSIVFANVVSAKEIRLYCKHIETKWREDNIANIGDTIIILDTKKKDILRAPWINDMGPTIRDGRTIRWEEDYISWDVDGHFQGRLSRDTLQLKTEKIVSGDLKEKSLYSCSISKKKI